MCNEFCPRDCVHLSITEEEQTNDKTRQLHICTKYGARLYHLLAPNDLYKCEQCHRACKRMALLENDSTLADLNMDKVDALLNALGFHNSFEKEELLDEAISTIIDLLYFIANNYGEESYVYRELAPIEDKLKRVLKLIEAEDDI